jgi:hypothetical protein
MMVWKSGKLQSYKIEGFLSLLDVDLYLSTSCVTYYSSGLHILSPDSIGDYLIVRKYSELNYRDRACAN